MARAERPATRFLAALVGGARARHDGDRGFVTTSRPPVRLGEAEIRRLVSSGLLQVAEEECRATEEARPWLLRRLAAADAFALQHRLPVRDRDGTERNLAESPLGRLAAARQGEPPFLLPHQLAAGERVRQLVERARLRPRTTMSYEPRTGGGRAGQGVDLPDLALDARRMLDDIARLLPADCAGVVVDVCGLLKGLQEVELERGWPRRSAKLVLRIGLEQLAQHFGMASEARGPNHGRQRAWVGPEGRPRGVY
ncbi:MAG TPA: DUF6456 domain-containing protein [Devosiaceae bacterium]|jgi:hypothetical protein|nr:DUF6456 domain-containing protein [Devosiaceae bacterium]